MIKSTIPVVIWTLARVYVRVYAWIKDTFGSNLKGLGWVLRRIPTDNVITVDNLLLYFDRRIASTYCLLIVGRSNEPETPVFVARMLDRMPAKAVVVDVGANVGDIALRAAAHPQALRVLAFEPHPIAAAALRRSVELNRWRHVEVFEELVGDGGSYAFAVDEDNASVSAIAFDGTTGSTPSVRLDDRLADVDGPLLMVIDVEGAEPLVLAGAAQTIARLQPVIVFEYNFVSRRHYALAEVQAILGTGYEIRRLRRDGRLDDECENAWNCVALPPEWSESLLRQAT